MKIILRILFICILPLLVVTNVHAAKYVGLDILGLAAQDIPMIAAQIPQDTAIGVLDGTFGDVEPALRQLLSTKKVPAWRVHLSNGSCDRNNTCESEYEIEADDLAALSARASKFEKLHQEFPETVCILSPRLEHDEKSEELVNAWVAALKRSAPSCHVVISAIRGYSPLGILTEQHGSEADADITSLDGALPSVNLAAVNPDKARLIAFAWIPLANLRSSSNRRWVPPSQRKLKLGPADIITMLQQLSRGKSAGINQTAGSSFTNNLKSPV